MQSLVVGRDATARAQAIDKRRRRFSKDRAEEIVRRDIVPTGQEMESGFAERKENVVGGAAQAGEDIGMPIDQPHLILDGHRLRVGDREPIVSQQILEFGFTDHWSLPARQATATQVERLV